MNNKTFGCVLAAVVVVLLVSIGFNFLQFLALLGAGTVDVSDVRIPPKMSETQVEAAESGVKSKIVQIDVEGVISSFEAESFLGGSGSSMVDKVKRALRQAREDDSVKAIILKINSPGGEVTASDILYAAVKETAEVKPVVVYMESMAASGGYYIACGATKIVASETTLTASIGVIIQGINYSNLFGKVGLEAQTFTSGAFKDTLSGARPMREDEKAYVQGLVDDMYGKFLGIVAEARKVPAQTLKNTVADGRVVTGGQALEAKLVDQLGYIEDAYALAMELGDAKGARVVRYGTETNFFDALGLMSASAGKATPEVKLDLGASLGIPLRPGVPYFLPAGMVR